jgi:hypothetical protein
MDLSYTFQNICKWCIRRHGLVVVHSVNIIHNYVIMKPTPLHEVTQMRQYLIAISHCLNIVFIISIISCPSFYCGSSNMAESLGHRATRSDARDGYH